MLEAVPFSQNKPAIRNQPAVLFSQTKPAPTISNQPNKQGVRCELSKVDSSDHDFFIFQKLPRCAKCPSVTNLAAH
jgi:hypothetical protein